MFHPQTCLEPWHILHIDDGHHSITTSYTAHVYNVQNLCSNENEIHTSGERVLRGGGGGTFYNTHISTFLYWKYLHFNFPLVEITTNKYCPCTKNEIHAALLWERLWYLQILCKRPDCFTTYSYKTELHTTQDRILCNLTIYICLRELFMILDEGNSLSRPAHGVWEVLHSTKKKLIFGDL
jgi:hypothetical protein